MIKKFEQFVNENLNNSKIEQFKHILERMYKMRNMDQTNVVKDFLRELFMNYPEVWNELPNHMEGIDISKINDEKDILGIDWYKLMFSNFSKHLSRYSRIIDPRVILIELYSAINSIKKSVSTDFDMIDTLEKIIEDEII